MLKPPLPHLLPLALLLGASSFAISAQAQSDEIIVTATKISASPHTIGASISVIDGEPLGSFDGAEELSQRVSGLQAAIANGSQIAFQIRGIGAVDHQALTPTATAVYVDGVYKATNVQTSPLLFDMARAEVLKGPQGSLYGRNASAGAINFISVKPTGEKAGYLRGEFGNNARVNITAAASLPLSDIFSLRLAARRLTSDAALENVQTNPAVDAPDTGGGTRDELGLRATGLLRASPNTEVMMSAHYAQDKGINGAPLNSSLELDDHQISIGPDGIQQSDNSFYGASVELTHEYGSGVTLTSLSAYEGYNQQYGFDFDGTPAPFNVASLNANLAYDRDFTMVSEELRLAKSTQRGDFMGGLYLEAEDFAQDYLIWCGELDADSLLGTCRYVGAPGRAGPNPASGATATSLLSQIKQERKTAALFSYNTLHMSEKLDVIIGARLTSERIEGSGQGLHYFDDGVIALNNRNGLGLARGSNGIKEQRLSGTFGLNYRPSDDVLVYGVYSNGFKSGGFNGEVINNATHFTDEGLFGAETVDAVEAGAKFNGDKFSANASAFYNLYDSPQARIFVPFSTQGGGSFTSNSLSNLDEAASYGVEITADWQAMDGLDISGSATWLDSEILQDSNPATPQNAAAFDGNSLPFASEISTVISGSYTWNLNDNIEAMAGLNGKYQSEFYLDAEGRDDRKQDGYGLIDGRAQLAFSNGMSAQIWGRNLTNTDYAVSGFGFIGYNTFRGAPRSYGVTLGYAY